MVRSRLAVVVLALAVPAAGCSILFDTFKVTVPSESMEPTIEKGATVTVTKVTDGYEPDRGDIVLFDDPGGWLTGGDDGQMIKRVVGIAGDTVECCDESGRIVVNGDPVDEPYLAETATCAASGFSMGCDWSAGPVPDESVFVLGDNRDASADSRAHMCPDEEPCDESPWVPVDLIKGTIEVE